MTLTKDQRAYLERLYAAADQVHERFSKENITDYQEIRPWVQEICDPIKHCEGLDKKELEGMLAACARAMRRHRRLGEEATKPQPEANEFDTLANLVAAEPGMSRLAEQMDLIINVLLGR